MQVAENVVEKEIPGLGGKLSYELIRLRVLYTMAELFATMGYTAIKATLAGYDHPGHLKGRIQDHQPKLSCRQNDRKATPLLLDVILPVDLRENPEGVESRLTLFASARQTYGCELHIVIPNALVGESKEPFEAVMRRKLSALEITPNKLWVL